MNFQFSLILEYCPHGNIKNYLITHRNQFWASVVAYGSTRSPNLDNAISIDFKRPSPFPPEGTESRHTLPLLGIWAYQVSNLFVIYHSIRKILYFGINGQIRISNKQHIIGIKRNGVLV